MIEALNIFSQIAASIFIAFGVFFFLVGTTGLLRLPDFFCRTHAATKCDTLGASLILFGVAIYEKFSFDAFKVLAIVLFILVTSPTTGHALARAAFRRGLVPWRKEIPSLLKEEEPALVEGEKK